MGEIPSTFLSKKTFQSLPQLAFWTWIIVFIIDAIVLQQFTYSFMRVAAVWIIGLSVSFIFEIVRYKNLSPEDKAEYGYKFFFVLNAFLIFFYAASFTGLTKQIGAWGELPSTLNQHGSNLEKSNILLEAQEWAIPLLARQTSYFPDITAIAENNHLKEENAKLQILVPNRSKLDSLSEQIVTLKDSLENCTKKNYTTSTNLSKELDFYKAQVEVLSTRIMDFNARQNKWRQVETIVFGAKKADFKRQINEYVRRVDPNEADFYEFIFNTPINVELPQYNSSEAPVK